MAVEAGEYVELTGTDAYAVEARRWLGNILGANAWGIDLTAASPLAFACQAAGLL